MATRVVASTTTNADGGYSLSPNLADLPARYVEPDGTVNLEVDTTSATLTQQWNLPSALPGSAAAGYPTMSVARIRPARVAFNLGRSTVTTTLAGKTATHAVATARAPVRAARLQAHAVAPQAVTPDGPPFEGGCDPWKTGTTYYNRNERFINVWAMTQAHATVIENVGSSHTLGIAVNYGNGGYGVSGSASIHTQTSAGGEWTTAANRTVYNSVNYRQYYRTCYHPYGSEIEHMAKPLGFYDIIHTAVAIDPNTWTGCVTKGAGTVWTKSKGTNVEFSAGVSLPFASVSSQASYSSSTEITWRPTGSVLLCGSSQDGWVSSAQAAVHGVIVTCQPGKPC